MTHQEWCLPVLMLVEDSGGEDGGVGPTCFLADGVAGRGIWAVVYKPGLGTLLLVIATWGT